MGFAVDQKTIELELLVAAVEEAKGHSECQSDMDASEIAQLNALFRLDSGPV